MKNILFVSILFATLQLNSISLFSQEENKESYKNNITFNVTRLALLEARFGYERLMSERHLLRTTLGIQFPINSESFSYRFYVPFYYTVSKGVYFSLGYNYIINPHSKLYLSTEVYINYSYYDNKYYEYCVGQSKESYVTLQSMQLRKSGIKLLIGKKLFNTSRKKNRLQLDIFCGIGAQYRQEDITIFKKKVSTCDIDSEVYDFHDYDPPQKEISIGWWPTLHGGILLSFAF